VPPPFNRPYQNFLNLNRGKNFTGAFQVIDFT
jgi:hypothetical protein